MKWSEKSLGYLSLRATSGGTPSTSNASFYGGEIPWLRTQEVTFNFIQDTEIKISDAGLENSSAKWIAENSVIVALYGNSAGRVAVNKIRLTTNQACGNFTIDPAKADYRFVYYELLKDYEILHGMSKGAAQNNLNLAMVRDYKLRVPQLATQSRIGDMLVAYDDLMENSRRRMVLLEESARLLYREWFVHLRFPGHNERMKDGLPQGWERVPLGEVMTLQRGHDLPSQERVEGDIPIVSSSGITGFHDKKKADAPGVVTGRYGTLGQVYYIDRDYWPLNTALYVTDFKGHPPLYILHLLKHALESIQSDKAAIPGLNRNVVHAMKVFRPPAALRIAFGDFAADVYRQISILTDQTQKLRTARDLLLPRLMSGEIEV